MVFSRTVLTIHPMTAPVDETATATVEYQPIIKLTSPIQLPVEVRPHTSFQSPSVYLGKTLENNDAYLVRLPDLQAIEDRKLNLGETLYPVPTAKPKPPSRNLAPLLTTELTQRHRIEPANVYAPIDIIAIDERGFILKIWPNIILANISGPILLPAKSHAILYLAGNRTAQLGVTPHDRIENELFAKSIKSLQ